MTTEPEAPNKDHAECIGEIEYAKENADLRAKLREAEERESRLHAMRAEIIDVVRDACWRLDHDQPVFASLRAIVRLVEANEPAAPQDTKDHEAPESEGERNEEMEREYDRETGRDPRP